MEKDKYRLYTSEMLVDDPDFKRWVRHRYPSDEAYWNGFLLEYSDRKAEVDRAISILETLNVYYSREYSKGEIESSFSKVKQGIEKKKPIGVVSFGQKARRIAAGVAILLGLSLSFLYLTGLPDQNLVEYNTKYGEQKRFTLPDGTTVVLNANSKLNYDSDWTQGQTREVSLHGEAYFDVVKDLSEKAKFIVHASGLDVEVYGTQFNVNSRTELTEVALEEGSIKINFNRSLRRESISMVPGEVISFESNTKQVRHEISDRDMSKTERYTSWKDGSLLFKNELLSEVLDDLTDIYGISYRLDQPELKKKRISGGVPIEDLKIALETLTGLYGLKVNFQEGVYIISQ